MDEPPQTMVGVATRRYLTSDRLLQSSILQAVIAADAVGEGPYGSMWAAHTDDGWPGDMDGKNVA
ncbi:DUF3991 domain-containing protein [Agrobacterium tumefaciens]|uniref:DUF3991 domain-containing protein n=1 Tax=Agrobacterium tumefaciens TaxID=358 RepID=UPI003D9C331B